MCLAVPSLLVCTVFCSLCLILPPIFLECHSELRKRGLSTARSRSLLGAASKLLNTSGRPLVLPHACGRFVTRASVYERPPSRPQPGPATQGFWLLPGVRFPPFLELTSLTSSIILEKGVGHYSSRPLVVLDSVVRQRPGHLVLDGYHCLHSLTPFPRVGGGGDLIK